MASILGVIGLTEDSIQLLRWMVCGPEVARSVRDFEASLPYNLETSLSIQTKHHEQTPSAQKRFSKNAGNFPASRKSFLRRIEKHSSTGLKEHCKSKCSWQYEESCWIRGKVVQWIFQWPLKRKENKYLWNNKEKQVCNLHPTI